MTSVDFKFMKFVTEHGKSYATTEEFDARKEHFMRADYAYEQINNNPDSHMIAGHNKFSDWTPEEIDRMMGLKFPHPEKTDALAQTFADDINLPTSVDWRTSGNVTAVKDQGSCGSCWAFSSTGALESAYSIFGGELMELSEQQLVDCSKAYYNDGCSGGWYFWSYDYLKGTGAMMETETEYPYTARNGICKYKLQSDDKVTDKSYVQVDANPTAIKTAIAQQPCNVAVAAGNYVFQGYRGGIITSTMGCPTSVDHAILAVGYGNDSLLGDYLIVKNSWGQSWGESGYVRLQLVEGDGVCGVNQYVYYPNVL
jgi:C1A family cysteine protease